MTPILRRDGSAHSADSAGNVKVCAVATTKSSGRFHHRGAEYIALSSIFPDLCVLPVSAVSLFFDFASIIHISNPDLPDASNPTAAGGSALPAEFQSCIQGAANSWTIPASTRSTERYRQPRHALMS